MTQNSQPNNPVIIWMHGLGADANDMRGLADALAFNQIVTHHFLEAPIRPVTLFQKMPARAWYDLDPAMPRHSQDWSSTHESEQTIHQAIQAQIDNGTPSEKIFLAGFSQGAAMALFAGLRSEYRLGGIIALSGYLPWPDKCPTQQSKIPIFIGIGHQDEMVKPEWTQHSIDWLVENHFNRLTIQYYSMGHSVCIEEIKDIATWFSQIN